MVIPWATSAPSEALAAGTQLALETVRRVGWRCVYMARTHAPLSWVRRMVIPEV